MRKCRRQDAVFEGALRQNGPKFRQAMTTQQTVDLVEGDVGAAQQRGCCGSGTYRGGARTLSCSEVESDVAGRTFTASIPTHSDVAGERHQLGGCIQSTCEIIGCQADTIHGEPPLGQNRGREFPKQFAHDAPPT
jgi:hypothetical protein